MNFFIWIMCSALIWMILAWLGLGAKLQLLALLAWAGVSYYGYTRNEQALEYKVRYYYGGLYDGELFREDAPLLDKSVWMYKHYSRKIQGGPGFWLGWVIGGILGTFILRRIQYWFSSQTDSWSGYFFSVALGWVTLILAIAAYGTHYFHEKVKDL